MLTVTETEAPPHSERENPPSVMASEETSEEAAEGKEPRGRGRGSGTEGGRGGERIVGWPIVLPSPRHHDTAGRTGGEAIML